jgi:hypothetical protein
MFPVGRVIDPENMVQSVITTYSVEDVNIILVIIVIVISYIWYSGAFGDHAVYYLYISCPFVSVPTEYPGTPMVRKNCPSEAGRPKSLVERNRSKRHTDFRARRVS